MVYSVHVRAECYMRLYNLPLVMVHQPLCYSTASVRVGGDQRFPVSSTNNIFSRSAGRSSHTKHLDGGSNELSTMTRRTKLHELE